MSHCMEEGRAIREKEWGGGGEGVNVNKYNYTLYVLTAEKCYIMSH